MKKNNNFAGKPCLQNQFQKGSEPKVKVFFFFLV